MSGLTEWLKKVNKQMRDAGIEQHKRPWEALSLYSNEFKIPLAISSPVATEIFKWFETNSKPGVHKMGCQFQSLYYYDTVFWPVKIPVIYGRIRLNALDCLKMPDSTKSDFMSNARLAQEYVMFWADCVDYGCGIRELCGRQNLNPFGVQLMKAGDQDLRAAVSLLNEQHPRSRAILVCRMAIEIFLKAYLALKDSLTERDAKQYNHDLEKCFDRFIQVSGHTKLAIYRNTLQVFPPIATRYSEQSQPQETIWAGFALTQFVGSMIVREFTGRDTLSKMS